MPERTQPEPLPLIVTLEDGEAIQPFGLDMKIVVRSDQTGGKLSAILAVHQPGEGPPDHLHFHQEEVFFVLEGTYEVGVEGITRTVGPGTFVYLPRHAVHTFKNVGTTPAKMLDMSVPGGQDRYFREISDLAKGDGFSGEKIREISQRHDTNFPDAAHS